MVSTKKQGILKTTPVQTPSTGRLRSKFRDFTGRYLLKPLVLATFVIALQAFSPAPLSAKKPGRQADKSLIRASADSLELRPVSASKTLAHADSQIQAQVRSILSRMSADFPEAVKSWKTGRAIENLPAELEVRLVNRSKFEQIEDSGHSVRFDDFNLYVNTGVPFDPHEFAIILSYIFSRYGGFNQDTPFFFSDQIIMPSLMLYSLYGPGLATAASEVYGPEAERAYLTEDAACAIWFAQLVGIPNFVNAYFSNRADLLRTAYDAKFGAGKYAELLRQMNSHEIVSSEYVHPLPVISAHLKAIGADPDVWGAVQSLAKDLGFAVKNNKE